MSIVGKENNNNIKPEIKNIFNNISNYEIIFLFFPTWFEHLPKIIIRKISFSKG